MVFPQADNNIVGQLNNFFNIETCGITGDYLKRENDLRRYIGLRLAFLFGFRGKYFGRRRNRHTALDRFLSFCGSLFHKGENKCANKMNGVNPDNGFCSNHLIYVNLGLYIIMPLLLGSDNDY